MKKLTYEEFGMIMKIAFQREFYGEERLGQAIFNATYNNYPELADSLRATVADCFYQDSKIIHFIDAILEK